MATHTIKFRVQNNTFIYEDQTGKDAKRKPAKKKERIGWESQSGQDFTIDFPSAHTPFATHSFASSSGRVAPQKVIRDWDPNDPNQMDQNRYKYTVTMSPHPPDDPEIIIDPDGGWCGMLWRAIVSCFRRKK